MKFFLTTYLYPIENEITLSKSLRFSLDNPRTEEEFSIIKEYLSVSVNSPNEMYSLHNYMRPSVEELENSLSITDSLKKFRKVFSHNDSYVEQFFSRIESDDVLMKLAKMWIIARYDDEGESERLSKISQEEAEKGVHGFFMLGDDNPVIRNAKNLVNYSHLISLLIHNDMYYSNGSFISYDNSEKLLSPRIDNRLNHNLLLSCMMPYPHKDDDPALWHADFPFIKEKLLLTASNLEKILDDKSRDKILYVASLLKAASEDIHDDGFQLVTLVSILELLLTHNPDFNRYNVEDSISKQFKMKVASIVYLNDRNLNLEWLKKRLSTIYEQRSNISHGNFVKYKKYIESLCDEDGKEEYFSDLIIDLQKFIRAVLEEYIKDRDYLEFIKDN